MQKNSNRERVKKVVILGPECTGKSELSEYLALYFKTCWVKEYAREYLENLNRPYTETDLTKIANGQVRMEDKQMPYANEVVICDTNIIVIKIWSNFKYGSCSKEILQLIQSRTYDLYLLTYIDIPWQEDPQREHPNKRETLWEIYKTELKKQNLPFVEITGERKQRREIAVNAIDDLLSRD